MVQLAERVERFEPPFEWARNEYLGFAPGVRFLIERRLAGDAAASDALSASAAVFKALRLGAPFPDDFDLAERYLETHKAEYEAFVRRHYSWLTPPVLEDDDGIVRIGSKRESEYPGANAQFDRALARLRRLAPSGRTARRKSALTLEIDLGRTVIVGIDRGGSPPRLTATTYLAVPQFQYGHGLGDSFGFGEGWPEFRTSAADDLAGQVERFFASYERVFPHVLDALQEGIAAGDEYLSSIGKAPRGHEAVRGE